MRWRISAWTHPEDAGGFKLREHSVPAIKWTSSDSQDPRGRCTITVPETYPWQDLITVQNPADPSDTSLIRLYAEGIDNTGDPDQEFLLIRFQKRITDDGQAVVELFGQAWKVAGLNAAAVRWWDWQAGATVTKQPDWVYGGPNLLTNGDLEENGTIPNVWELFNDGAAADTFTVTDGTDITTAIAWDASAGTVETRIEADITAITQVIVTGEGTEAEPWTIEFSDPKFGITLSVSSTGMTSTLDELTAGGLDPTGWTKSQTVTRGVNRLFGEYASVGGFDVTDAVADTGTFSLRVNPLLIGRRYAGAQQVVRVVPGSTYQASIRIRPGSATDKFRFVLRSLDEDFIAWAGGSNSYATGTFTTVTISDIVIPEGVTEMIFRFANVDGAGVNPLPFHLDNAVLQRGLPASTIGVIANDLLADAKTDHAPGLVRIPYVDQGAYTATLDSAGAAFATEAISLRRGMAYATHVFGGSFADLGYEYDLTPNGDTAAWDLELWNEGGRGAALTGLAFVVGMGVGGGMVAGRMPRATRWLAEGKDGIITEAINAAQETASGVVEAFFADPDLADVASLGRKAQHFIDEDIANRLALSVELADNAPTPYTDFGIGDTVEFAYAGVMTKNDRRISEISLSAQAADGGDLHWTPTITASRLFIGQGATTEALLGLLTEYDRIDDDEGAGAFRGGGGLGSPFPIIAASDAPEWMKQTARWVCTGVDDRNIIHEALQEMIGVQGNVYLTPGTFNIDMTADAGGDPGIIIPTAISLIGAGQDATFIELVDADATAITQPLVELNNLSRLTDCSLEAYDGVTCLETSGLGSHMSRLWIRANGDNIGVHLNGGAGSTTWQVLEDSNVHCFDTTGNAAAVKITGLSNWVHIRRNNLSGGLDNIQLVDGSQPIAHVWITDNQLISAGRHGIHYAGSRGPGFSDIARNRIQDWGLEQGSITASAIYIKGISAAQIDDTATEVGYGLKITDNMMEAGLGHGIELEDVTGATVAGNYMEDAAGHGIFLSGDTDHCTITLNRMFYVGTQADNTWDAIHIEAGADENFIYGNTTRDSEAAGFDVQYALNVLGDLNIIGDNDFRFTGATGTINDGGTGNELIGNSKVGITDWTPTWTAVTTNPVIGDGTLTGRSQVIDKWLTGTLRLVIGSTTTLGAGAWEFDLPVVAALAFDHVIGTVHIEDSGTGFHTAVAVWNDTDSVINILDSGGAGKADATTPVAWATGDILTITFACEVA